MTKQPLYTVGGTVQAGGGLYVSRKADEEFLTLCRNGSFVYVLTSRQMGKSSLMVHAAEQLTRDGMATVIIDLTLIGVQITADEWYLGLLTKMADDLNMKADVIDWWTANRQLSPTQRLPLFVEKVLLTEVPGRVVIFVDEIDTTLSLPFTDDFYAALRYMYNARATMADFRRISFVLIGVAMPNDLISDPHRTPFNIGQRLDLTDFTFEEALPLAEGLRPSLDQGRQVLRWVMKWTQGHPYLTQRLCNVLVNRNLPQCTEADVDRIVAETFFEDMSDQDHNLQFVRDMLTERAPDRLRILATYRDIYTGKPPVHDDEQSIIKSHLKLSGIVCREKGLLVVRNPIYREVFNPQWIRDHWPIIRTTLLRRVLVSLAGVAILAIAFFLSVPLLRGIPTAAPPTASLLAAVRDVDLSIATLRILPANPAPGQKVAVALTLRNSGTTDSGPFKLALFSNPLETNVKPDSVTEVENLGPGESRSIVVDFIFPRSGTYTMTGWVNYDSAVQETNIFNNFSRGVPVQVNGPLVVDFALLPDGSPVLETRDLKGDEFAAWGLHIMPDKDVPQCGRAKVAIEVQDNVNRLVTKTTQPAISCPRLPVVFTFDEPVGGASVTFTVTASGVYTVQLFDGNDGLLQEGSVEATRGEQTVTISVPTSGSALGGVKKVIVSGPGATTIGKISFASPPEISTATAQAVQ
jgi:AAA-like domain/CARDB